MAARSGTGDAIAETERTGRGFALSDRPDFAGAPWQAVRWRRFGPARKIPTMLGREERRLYWWLTGVWARGRGAAVDLGCFAGGSTARLAEGAAHAGHGQQVHAYDRFTADEATKAAVLYPAGIAPFAGEDILPVARALLAPWADRIQLHRGEIEAAVWTGGPIEVLAVDAAKSAATADAIAQRFYPSLVSAGSVVVHQDFLHPAQPWIAAQMERLARHFEPVAFVPRDTVVFLTRSAPTPADLAAAAVAGLDDAGLRHWLARAEARYAPLGLGPRVAALSAALTRAPGAREAWRLRRAEAG
jgi:predicted O-methyltransferase YrrM